MKKLVIVLAVLAVILVGAYYLHFEPMAKANDLIKEGGQLCGQNQNEAAIEAYNKAIELYPESAGAYNNKAVALCNLGKYDEAVAAFDKVIGLVPDNASVYYGKGTALRELGKENEAQAAFNKAKEIDPNMK